MRQLSIILLGLILSLLLACGQGEITTPENAMPAFSAFKAKEKFVQDDKLMYPGISDPALLPILSKKLNFAAKDFEKIAQKESAKAKEYQAAIGVGLKRFSDIYLQIDTEDRERVCSYFEELMDIVGLESSAGQLNDFMYGFDPTE